VVEQGELTGTKNTGTVTEQDKSGRRVEGMGKQERCVKL